MRLRTFGAFVYAPQRLLSWIENRVFKVALKQTDLDPSNHLVFEKTEK
jgi:hypothetical protein